MFFRDATFQAETSFKWGKIMFSSKRPRKKAAAARAVRTLNLYDIVRVRVRNTPPCWVRAIKINADPDVHHLVTVSGSTENVTGGEFVTYGTGAFRQWLQRQGTTGRSNRQLARAYFSQTKLTNQEQTYIDRMGLEDVDEAEDVSTPLPSFGFPRSTVHSFASPPVHSFGPAGSGFPD